jgi:hypothetical protein
MTNILFRASLMKEIMYILIRWIVDTTTLPHWIRTFHSNIASAFFIEDMSGVQYVSVSDISIRHIWYIQFNNLNTIFRTYVFFEYIKYVQLV